MSFRILLNFRNTVPDKGDSGSQHRQSGIDELDDVDELLDDDDVLDRLLSDVEDSEHDELDDWLEVDVLEALEADSSLTEDDEDVQLDEDSPSSPS